jgi:dephospho-CoA kinase
MLKIGLTGGICAGKSTVLQELAALGAAVIDADKLGHKTYTVGSEPYHNLVAQFGDEIVAKDSKEIDRKVLGGLVFGKDNPRMKQLTDIVWPAVNRMLLEEFEIQKAAGTAVVVVENAMLLDMNMDKLVDTVWVCCVDIETARARLMQRNGFTSEEAGQRIAAQRSNDQRCAHADVILVSAALQIPPPPPFS